MTIAIMRHFYLLAFAVPFPPVSGIASSRRRVATGAAHLGLPCDRL